MKLFLNLSNGLDFLKSCPISPTQQVSCIRIQSTACEQKRWDFLIQQISDDFLYELSHGLSNGTSVRIIDYGKRPFGTRALYQGVPLLAYVLNRFWFNRVTVPLVKKQNVSKYFDRVYRSLNKATFSKLRYFRKFITHDFCIGFSNTVSNRGPRATGEFKYFNTCAIYRDRIQEVGL